MTLEQVLICIRIVVMVLSVIQKVCYIEVARELILHMIDERSVFISVMFVIIRLKNH